MEDIGFNGTGSKFNTRFGSNSSIMGKQLNDMSYGIQAGLPQPNVGSGQSISFTPGGALFTPESDPNVFGRYQYNADPPQFKCVVFIDPSGGPEQLKYYLKIARGNITACGTHMPFTQGTGAGTGSQFFYQDDFAVPDRQRMIFDVAISPVGSRTAGPIADSQSAWMASNGKFELDPEIGTYYVTASFFDYDDQLNWYQDETLINNHEPWISIVEATGQSKNNIFAEGRVSQISNYICGGGGELGESYGIFPTMLGYSMKVIARIVWKPELEMWDVRQELLGPITLDIPMVGMTNYDDVAPSTTNPYETYKNAKFISTIMNFNYIEKFKDSGFTNSDILAGEWWYDPKDI